MDIRQNTPEIGDKYTFPLVGTLTLVGYNRVDGVFVFEDDKGGRTTKGWDELIDKVFDVRYEVGNRIVDVDGDKGVITKIKPESIRYPYAVRLDDERTVYASASDIMVIDSEEQKRVQAVATCDREIAKLEEALAEWREIRKALGGK
jgi:hypothetical protein